MFVYFDEYGTLKEIISDKKFRVGDSKRDKIYVYWEGEHAPISGWVKYRKPNGKEYPVSVEECFFQLGDKLLGKTLPTKPLRNLKYFSYDHTYEENGVQKIGYKFYEITIPDAVLNSAIDDDEMPTENNMVVARIRFVMDENSNGEIDEADSIETLGAIVFSVETNIGILTDSSINESQYNYLISLIGLKMGLNISSEKVAELPSEGVAGKIYYVERENGGIVYDAYMWNGTDFVYLGTTSYDLYTKEEGEEFEVAIQALWNAELTDYKALMNSNFENYENKIDAKISSLSSLIQSAASGSPKGTYATLTALQNAYPNGTSGIYVVLEDGNWYYWNGNAWADGGKYLAGSADSELNPNSVNPVQNKVITNEFYSFLNRTDFNNVVGKRSPYTVSSGTTDLKLYAHNSLDKFTGSASYAKTFQRIANHKYLAVLKTNVIASYLTVGLWDTTSAVGTGNGRVYLNAVLDYSQLYAGMLIPTESEENSVFVAQFFTITTVGEISALGVIDVTELLEFYPRLVGRNNDETVKNIVDFVGEQDVVNALTSESFTIEMIKENKVDGLREKLDTETFYNYVYERVFEWAPIVLGGFTNTGEDNDYKERLRTQNYLSIDDIAEIHLILTSYTTGLTFKYSISFYSEKDTERIGTSGWQNLNNDGIIDFTNFVVPTGTKYMRMILAKTDDTDMSLNYVDKVLVYKNKAKEADVEENRNVIVYDRTLLKRTSATLSGDYLGTLENVQSFCKYNNKYISVEEGKITVQSETFVVEETKNISIGHANSIQIGESNFAYVSGWNDNKLYKVNVDTLSVDSTIDLPTTGWTTCAVDELRQIVYIFQRDTYPSNDSIYNFIAYDLTNSSIIFSRKTSIAFKAMQSCDYYQDKILVIAGKGNGTNKYMVFDTNGNLITTYQIPTKEAEEPEGVFIDRENDGFYITYYNRRVYKVS